MKGDVSPSECHDFRDRATGVAVRQLTGYKGHSHHLYFTNSGWWDGGARLLLGSDRGNRTDLYSLELATGELTQLTEHRPETDTELLFSSMNPLCDECYFVRERQVIALNLRTLAERVIYRLTPGFKLNILNCAADGAALYTGIFEDLSGQFEVDLLHGYVGFREYCEARPISRIVRIPVDGSAPEGEIVFEERAWIGHVNTSPRHPHLLSFCHEGPWNIVDHRIWGFDTRTGQAWKVRPVKPGKDVLGHEYWLRDGETIGYHGHIGGKPIYGFSRYDNSERQEAVMPMDSHHYHSNTRDLIVGDGQGNHTPYVLLWTWQGRELSAPRVLCAHHGSRHIQQVHIHPRFSPDGRQVLYTTDSTGYGQVHLVDLPDMDALPKLNAEGKVA